MPQGYEDWKTKIEGFLPNISYSAQIENGTQVIYTVTADCKFYMSACYLTALNSSGGALLAIMYIDNPSPTPNYPLLDFYVDNGSSYGLAIPLGKEMEIVAGAEIKIWSTAAGFYLTGGIIGYEIGI